MSLRKLAGLAAGFALAAGLVGAGVGANFTASVTAQENIHVGTFGCIISAATPGAVIAGNGSWVTYQAPDILLSTPGSAPFSFTVKNTGSIPDVLTVATSAVSAPWSIIGAPFAAVPLAAGASYPYSTGVSWTELFNAQRGASLPVTWTVSCKEDLSTVAFSSATVLLPGNAYPLAFYVNGTGFTPGPISVTWSYAWGTKGYVYASSATADGAGSFTTGSYENCFDQFPPSGVLVTTDQLVNVTATNGVQSATGTGILHCSLFANLTQ
jgi:hypothetical protein